MNAVSKRYIQSRQSMIDSQIHPMGVVSEDILESFATVPREDFVPEVQKGVCYCDEDIEIAEGRYLMEPAVFARLVQALEPQMDDVVLTIGSGIGYNAAILSHLVSTVIALEEDEALLKTAQESWNQHDYLNIAGVHGEICDGAPKNAPYDIIIFNGAVTEIPESIQKQLQIGGRLAALVRERGQGLAKAVMIERVSEDAFSSKTLFEAGTPYLKGFEPKKEFVF